MSFKNKIVSKTKDCLEIICTENLTPKNKVTTHCSRAFIVAAVTSFTINLILVIILTMGLCDVWGTHIGAGKIGNRGVVAFSFVSE